MSISVIIDSSVKESPGKAKIVIEGDDPVEVTSLDAKKLAMKAAGTLGVSAYGICGSSGAYSAALQTENSTNGITVTKEAVQRTSKALTKHKSKVKFRNDIYVVSQGHV